MSPVDVEIESTMDEPRHSAVVGGDKVDFKGTFFNTHQVCNDEKVTL